MRADPKQSRSRPDQEPTAESSLRLLDEIARQNANAAAAEPPDCEVTQLMSQPIRPLTPPAGAKPFPATPADQPSPTTDHGQPPTTDHGQPQTPAADLASGTPVTAPLRLELIQREAEENSLIARKLGAAASLFFALRAKHPPTASHSLRVALSCSAWIGAFPLDVEDRSRIVVAALMHDLGKLGIPDRILRKPGKLSPEERATISLAPLLGCDILRGCSQDRQMLEIVRHATDWYGGGEGQKRLRDQLPLGSRIIAIADAFDSMTTDQVYRPAMSREAAVGNLFSGSGIQFDPELVRIFVAELEKSPLWPPESSKRTWLSSLSAADTPWQEPIGTADPTAELAASELTTGEPPAPAASEETLPASTGGPHDGLQTGGPHDGPQTGGPQADDHAPQPSNHEPATTAEPAVTDEQAVANEQAVTDGPATPNELATATDSQIVDLKTATANAASLHDPGDPLIDPLLGALSEAVIFVDTDGVIRQWNEAASRLTGIAASAVQYHDWKPTIISLLRADTETPSGDCPVEITLQTRTGVTGRFNICRCDGATLPIILRSVLVASPHYGTRGVLLVMQDMSAQFHLEDNVRTLQRQVSHDTLTGVANRAEMDRRLHDLIHETRQSFSLTICDIDHFKSVNDIHGHQAGDEALVRVAQILAARAQATDLVCRYGGEEFVVISPGCDLVAATRSAEAVRQAIESTELAMLDNSHITASFGVTQVQAGDTAESVFARADRALLQAKDTGRNQVIQLGVGGDFQPYALDPKKQGWFSRLLFKANENRNLQATITTPVPFDLAVSKLRGFLADHRAEILTVSEGQMRIRLNVLQRNTDRRVFRSMQTFLINLKIREVLAEIKLAGHVRTTTQQRTTVNVSITPEYGSRRASDIVASAQNIIVGLNGYLIGQIEQDGDEEN